MLSCSLKMRLTSIFNPLKHEITLHNASRPHPVSWKAGLKSNTEVSTRKSSASAPAGLPHRLWTSHAPQSHKPVPWNTLNTSSSFCFCFCGNPWLIQFSSPNTPSSCYCKFCLLECFMIFEVKNSKTTNAVYSEKAHFWDPCPPGT